MRGALHVEGSAQTKPIGSYFPGNTLAFGMGVFLISPANNCSQRGSPEALWRDG